MTMENDEITPTTFSDDFITRLILVCNIQLGMTTLFTDFFPQDYFRRKRYFNSVCALEEDSGWTNQELGKVMIIAYSMDWNTVLSRGRWAGIEFVKKVDPRWTVVESRSTLEASRSNFAHRLC